MITVKKLNKYYNRNKQNEAHVLKNVDLELPDRGMVAIFGQSGCGKTTLLNLLGGLDRYDSGEILLGGEELRKDADLLRNRYMGYIFQNYRLLKNETCFQNVADALLLCGMEDREEIERRTLLALKNVGMENYKLRYPDHLSGGQQQRIAIARAIVKNPRIILADEPTGNLDEANTLMVMDLLKQVAKDHLVLLVTHEENLVDHYCDTVIELRDGETVHVRNNENARGMTKKSRNRIYLGELPKTETENQSISLAYYGDQPENPIRIKLVHHMGGYYLQVDTPGVKVLEEGGEIQLKEGVFTGEEENEESRNVDMSGLPAFEGEHFGRLFRFRETVKESFRRKPGSRKKKVRSRAFSLFLTCFACVMVILTASFGKMFGNLKQISNSYNPNVFYLYLQDGNESSEKLLAALGRGEGGIDSVYVQSRYPYSMGLPMNFSVGGFESYSGLLPQFGKPAVLLPLPQQAKFIEGTRDSIGDGDMVITTAYADLLLENSPLSYVKERRDLMGLSTALYVGERNRPFTVRGIVESPEIAVYFDPLTLAKMNVNQRRSNLYIGEEKGFSVSSGETVLFTSVPKETLPQKGESVMLRGMQFTVKDVVVSPDSYGDYLRAEGIQKENFQEKYAKEIMESGDEAVLDKYYFSYMQDFLSEMKGFSRVRSLFIPSFEGFLAVEKNNLFGMLRIMQIQGGDTGGLSIQPYIAGCIYNEEHGHFPTYKEALAMEDRLGDVLNRLLDQYEREYHVSDYAYASTLDCGYAVCGEDYISLSQRWGESHESFEFDPGMPAPYKASYAVIHTRNPEKTEAWLRENFKDGSPFPSEPELRKIVTPTMVKEGAMTEDRWMILGNSIGLAVMFSVMALCMYFIMRAQLFSQIRTIGIYRSIGVSKKNLVFKYGVESGVIALKTVLVGHLLTSLVMARVAEVSANFAYYPLWLSLLLLAVLLTMSVFFGILPVISLLRKTPSEIIAKYDI